MEETQRILELLEQKKALFIRFERHTEEMLTCPAEELEELVARREQLITQIDALDRAVRDAAAGSPLAPDILRAVQNQGDRGDLRREVLPLYDAAAGIRTVACRLMETEAQASVRLRLEQERILELIKSANRGAEGQAARFLSTGDRDPRPASIAKA